MLQYYHAQQTRSITSMWFSYNIIQVVDKGYFSDAFLFKPRGGRSPQSGLNRKPRKNPLFSLLYGAGANKHVLLTPDEINIHSSLHPA